MYIYIYIINFQTRPIGLLHLYIIIWPTKMFESYIYSLVYWFPPTYDQVHRLSTGEPACPSRRYRHDLRLPHQSGGARPTVDDGEVLRRSPRKEFDVASDSVERPIRRRRRAGRSRLRRTDSACPEYGTGREARNRSGNLPKTSNGGMRKTWSFSIVDIERCSM